MSENGPEVGVLALVEEGDWAGWSVWQPGDPFEDHAGPFYSREEARGEGRGIVCGFMPETKNLNGFGAVHGGALMTFADFALFRIPGGMSGGMHGVTVAFTAEFLAPAYAGTILTARGETLRQGRSLVFVRGLISQGESAVLSFSGTIKRVG
jgi:uncharacterized protein (TIGR00369 family)